MASLLRYFDVVSLEDHLATSFKKSEPGQKNGEAPSWSACSYRWSLWSKQLLKFITDCFKIIIDIIIII